MKHLIIFLLSIGTAFGQINNVNQGEMISSNKINKLIDHVNSQKIAIVKDVKYNNVASVAGGVVTRNLNTLERDTDFISLDGDGFILEAEKYSLDFYSSFHRAGHTKIYLYDVTNSNIINPDTNMLYDHESSGTAIIQNSDFTILEINQPTKFELRHWTESSRPNGLSGSITARNGDIGNSSSAVAGAKIIKLK